MIDAFPFPLVVMVMVEEGESDQGIGCIRLLAIIYYDD